MRPKDDLLNYRHIELDNGLRAILVENSNNVKFYVRLCVDVGFVDDPDGATGAAHLLEHVLYSGSAKYPEAGAYWKTLSDSGCLGNGSTSERKTCFKVNGPLEAFASTLDMFVDALVNPLFLNDRIENEIKMVDNEFTDYRNTIHDYIAALQDTLLHVNEPHVGFGAGNAATLQSTSNIDVIIRRLYQNHYVAPNMTLCIFSGFSLDHMESVVVDKFSALPDTLPNIDWARRRALLTAHPPRLGVLARTAFDPEETFMFIAWEVPNDDSISKYWAVKYVMRMLTIPFEGFLLDMLKTAALGVDVDIHEIQRLYGFPVMHLRIRIHMTPRGVAAPMLVIDAIMQYLKHLNNVQLAEQYWDVLREKALVKIAKNEHLDELGEHLSEHEPERCIVDQFLPPEFNEITAQAIKDLILVMANPDNMLAIVTTLSTNGIKKVEKFFQTEYTIDEMRLRRMLSLYKSNMEFAFANKLEFESVPFTTPLVCGNNGESCSDESKTLAFHPAAQQVKLNMPITFRYALDERTKDAHIHLSLRACDKRSAKMRALTNLWASVVSAGFKNLVNTADDMGVSLQTFHSHESMQFQVIGRHGLIIPMLKAALSHTLGNSLDHSQKSFLLCKEYLSVALSQIRDEINPSYTTDASELILNGLMSGPEFTTMREVKEDVLYKFGSIIAELSFLLSNQNNADLEIDHEGIIASSLIVADLDSAERGDSNISVTERNSLLYEVLNKRNINFTSTHFDETLFSTERDNATDSKDIDALVRLYNRIMTYIVHSSLAAIKKVAIDVLYRGPLSAQNAFELIFPIVNQVSSRFDKISLCNPNAPLRSIVPVGTKIISVATTGLASTQNNVVIYSLYMEPATIAPKVNLKDLEGNAFE